MHRVDFVDTSVLCEFLEVPGRCQRKGETRAALERRVADGVQLVIPIAAVIETGNHIAQAGRGDAARRSAERLVGVLEAGIAGTAPWVIHAVGWDGAFLQALVRGVGHVPGLVEMATQGIGAGDVSILAECLRFRARTANTEVGVWTYDVGLGSWV